MAPVGARDDVPDDDLAEGVTFHLFDIQDGSSISTTVPDSAANPATVLAISRTGDTLTITPTKVAGDWACCCAPPRGMRLWW